MARDITRRRRFQFTLTNLMWVVFIAALLLAAPRCISDVSLIAWWVFQPPDAPAIGGPRTSGDCVAWAKDSDATKRHAAATALGVLRLHEDEIPRVVQTLNTLLKDPNGSVRFMAAHSLYRFKADDPETLSNLIEALNDDRADVRTEAADTLGQIGPTAIDAIPALKEKLQDRNYSVREAAAGALTKIENRSSVLSKNY